MSYFTKLSFIVKCIFALIFVLIIFKHPKYTIRKNFVDMCAVHGRGAIEICLSEKGALARKRLGNAVIRRLTYKQGFVVGYEGRT